MKAVYFSGTILVSFVAFLHTMCFTFLPIWCTLEIAHYLQILRAAQRRWYQGVQASRNPWYLFQRFAQFCSICLAGSSSSKSAKDMDSSQYSKLLSSCLCSCRRSLILRGSSLYQNPHNNRQWLYLLWKSLEQRWERANTRYTWANQTRRCRILSHRGCRCRAEEVLGGNQLILAPAAISWSMISRTCRGGN